MRNSIILLYKENTNFHVSISEQFTILECMRPSFEGWVIMDL